MTATEVMNLAFKYAESRFGLDLDCSYYVNAAEWFKTNTKFGTEEDYSVFMDIVFMWTKNKYELLLSDAYSHFPDIREI